MTPELRQRLRQHHLFATLEDHDLERIMADMQLLALEADQPLFGTGDTAEHFFLLLEGRIRLYRRGQRGREKVILLIGPGQCFAEGVMFLERPVYPLNAAALVPSRLCAFHKTPFLEMLKRSPPLCLRLLGDMSRRLHARIDEIDALSLQNARFRVVHYLCELLGATRQSPANLLLPARKSVVASRISVTPETFSRVLHDLSDEGILTVRGCTVQVRDVAGLRRAGGPDALR